MATVVNIPGDERYAVAGDALGKLAAYWYEKRKDDQLNTQVDQYVKQINDSPDFDSAMKIYYSAPAEVREKKGTLIRQAVLDRHPGFEAFDAYTATGTPTKIVARKGTDPRIAAKAEGATFTGPADAWGVDVPGIGVLSAPDETTAKGISEKFKAKGQDAPVLNPSEVKIRLASEQTEAKVLGDRLAANAKGKENSAKDFEVTLNARYNVERANDPLSKETGVKVLIDTENDAMSNFKTRFGSTDASGAITLTPGQEAQYVTSLNTYQRLVARGANPSTATGLAELAGRLQLNPGMLDEAGVKGDSKLSSELTTRYNQLDRELRKNYGVDARSMQRLLDQASASSQLGEFDPLGSSAPIPGAPAQKIKIPIEGTGKAIVVIKVNGQAIPVGTVNAK